MTKLKEIKKEIAIYEKLLLDQTNKVCTCVLSPQID